MSMSHNTPLLIKAQHLHGYQILLTFADGRTGVLDLSDELDGTIFQPLRNPHYFAQFVVDRELNTLRWPNGADLAPEYLYDAVVHTQRV